MNGIRTPYTRAPRELPCPFRHVGTQREGAACEPGRGFPPDGCAAQSTALLSERGSACGASSQQPRQTETGGATPPGGSVGRSFLP